LEKVPSFKSDKFECPHCSVTAQQYWFDATSASKRVNFVIQHTFLNYRANIKDYQQETIESFIENSRTSIETDIKGAIPPNFSIATCASCDEITLWIDKGLIYPKKTSLPSPNSDLDQDIKLLYQEAAIIFTDSPKGATALLRLALQKLLKQIGKNGKDINKDIKELVSNGLSPKIQQALDILRVVGNNAVHPGQIDLDDNSEIALKLFQILNFIADEMITKPKELEKLYDDIIPEDTKEHIKQRDSK
jgi:Domain of unknown function (DUF4145)